MKITMLGTGHAAVMNCYNTCFLMQDGEKSLLVDCGGGNGILKQLQAVEYELSDLHEIFITHKHVDHLLGVFWILRIICQGMVRGSYEGNLVIHSHEEVIHIIRNTASLLLNEKEVKTLDTRVLFHVITDGEQGILIGKQVTYIDKCSTKANQFAFAMEYEKGHRLLFCGDEPLSKGEESFALKSDWMLHEAFCLYKDRDIHHPYEKKHSTAKDAAELAERYGVRNLLLFHTEEDHLPQRKELYSREASKYFSGKVYVPDDLEEIVL